MAKATKASTKKRSSKKASAKSATASTKVASAPKKPTKAAAAKKTAKKAVKKASKKKTVAKKTAAKKTAGTKAVAKKAAARKPAVKPVAKKKKTVKKVTSDSAAPAKKKSAAKRASRGRSRGTSAGATPATWNAVATPAAVPQLAIAGDEKQAPKSFQRQYKTWLQRLIGLRRRLLGETTQLEEEALRAADGDVSIDHMADYGSDSFEQEFTLSLIESKSDALRDVDEAIRKIEVCTYGLCEECETLIPRARLEVLPHTALCIECKSAQESAAGF